MANILLEQIDEDRVAALRETQLRDEIAQATEQFSSDDEEFGQSLHYHDSDTAVRNADLVDHENTSKLLLWGKSKTTANHVIGEDRWKKEQATAASSSSTRKNNLTQEEKVLLVNEFTSTMFDSFLQGKDDFDYR